MRSRATTGIDGRAGAALATVVLFAMVILLAGHGILVLGRTQRWIAAADGARWVEDESRRAALMGATAGLDSLPPEGPLDAGWWVVEVQALAPELRLLRVEPEAGHPGSGWATLLAAPLPVPRVLARSAAVRVGGVAFEAGEASDAPSDEVCPTELVGVPANRVGPLPDSPPRPRLGALDLEHILAALPPLTGDRLELPADGADACEEASSFGDPERPGSCPGVWGAGARVGDLVLAGSGQGVLAVSGDLTLAADAYFRGWLWVGGTLRIAPGAELRGLADVGDRFAVEPGGTLVPDGCAGALALDAARVIRVPRRVGPRAWPLFRTW